MLQPAQAVMAQVLRHPICLPILGSLCMAALFHGKSSGSTDDSFETLSTGSTE